MSLATDPLLKTRNLGKVFGRIVAVRHLDIELRAGEVLGFLGPNGSGKSTTIGMLLGLVSPTTGDIELFGKPIGQCGTGEYSRIGAVLEKQPLFPFLSGWDNLEVHARLLGIGHDKIRETLHLVGLGGRERDKAGTYSQGMRQRLSLAAALMPDPDVLILDEPTSGMDPSGMREVRDLIKDLGKQGKAVFLSSHLLHEVEQVSTKVVIIKSGEVLAQGTIQELLHGGNVLMIRVSESQQAADVIKALDWVKSVAVEGDMLRVSAPQERARDISAALAQKGMFPSEMRVVENSLEDFFQEVTRDSEGGNA